MTGLEVLTKCPYCGEQQSQYLSSRIGYYSVNGSDKTYIKCECNACNNKFWMSHDVTISVDTMKCEDTDDVKLITVICW